ncbi:hypothetical protein C2G38_2123980, partial [Gigaspora rosea]
INCGGSGVIYKRLRDVTQIQNFNSEVKILRIAQGHPNIITFYGVTEVQNADIKF